MDGGSMFLWKVDTHLPALCQEPIEPQNERSRIEILWHTETLFEKILITSVYTVFYSNVLFFFTMPLRVYV